jgi:hypothetical protein
VVTVVGGALVIGVVVVVVVVVVKGVDVVGEIVGVGSEDVVVAGMVTDDEVVTCGVVNVTWVVVTGVLVTAGVLAGGVVPGAGLPQPASSTIAATTGKNFLNALMRSSNSRIAPNLAPGELQSYKIISCRITKSLQFFRVYECR